jgi:hypothetical protein
MYPAALLLSSPVVSILPVEELLISSSGNSTHQFASFNTEKNISVAHTHIKDDIGSQKTSLHTSTAIYHASHVCV